MIAKQTSLILLIGIALVLLVIGLLIQPIAQPEEYHNFAAQSRWLGVDNAWNVFSNIAFALAGSWGLWLLLSPGKVQFIDHRERWFWIGFAVGLILTAIGSSYYHLAPDNPRLVWDRLPMTLVFMSYVTALIGERINMTLSVCLWPILIAIGILSVFYWDVTEMQGAGDLRLYVGVQGFAILATFVMVLTASPYTRNSDLAIVAAFYLLAKIVELIDRQIAMFTHGFMSGHPLKHLAAALAGAYLIRMIWLREVKS